MDAGLQQKAKLHQPPAHGATYRPDIDGLRAIAVVSVVLFHTFPSILRGGFVGVDIFFVISGFLITRIIASEIDESRFRIANFYARRIRRIFPALITVLLACLLFGWKAMMAEDLEHLAQQAVGGAAFIANLLLWHDSGYFDQAAASKPLLHLWSLGVEEQFYLAWPLMLWCAKKVRIPLTWVIGTTALISFVFSVIASRHNPTEAFYSPLSRAWELMAGSALACWHLDTNGSANHFNTASDRSAKRDIAFRNAISMFGIVCITYAFFRINEHMPFPGKWALFPTIGSAAMIAAGSETLLSRKLLSLKPMVWIGLISYPIYLWHWPLLVIGQSVVGTELSLQQKLCVIALTILLSWLTWRYIELPFRNTAHRRIKVSALTSLMTLIALASIIIWKEHGIPSRYPPIVQRATEYNLEAYRTALRNHICFMEVGEKWGPSIIDNCVDGGKKPLWVIWGDSAGASLYIGFRSLAQSSSRMRLGQFTSSSCAPFIGSKSGNPACSANNATAIEVIEKIKPDTVILAAMWHEYDKLLLANTISRLKTDGFRRIVILGPPPSWEDTPSRIVFNEWKRDPLHLTPKLRLNYAKYGRGNSINTSASMDIRTSTAEAFLKNIAQKYGVQYVSLTQSLCNTDGCLIARDEKSGEPLYLDVVHMTPAGAKLAIHLVSDQLFQ